MKFDEFYFNNICEEFKKFSIEFLYIKSIDFLNLYKDIDYLNYRITRDYMHGIYNNLEEHLNDIKNNNINSDYIYDSIYIGKIEEYLKKQKLYESLNNNLDKKISKKGIKI